VRAAACVTVLIGGLALVSCGGSGGEEVTATEPAIPRRVADELADRADEVARLLDQGDACGAARLVRELRRATNRAVADRTIPEALRAPLETALADLKGIKCTEGEGGTSGETATTSTTTSGETPTTETTTGTTTTPDTTTSPSTTTEATQTTEG
jgi:hypothetical protein